MFDVLFQKTPTLQATLSALITDQSLYPGTEAGSPCIFTTISLSAGEEDIQTYTGEEAQAICHQLLTDEDPAQRLLALAYLARELHPIAFNTLLQAHSC